MRAVRRSLLPFTLSLGLALAALPRTARAQTQTVDQVLAAVAEVVRDRAKHVATRVIQQRLQDQLCSGSIRLPRRPAPTGDAPPPLELFLGGRQACREGYLRAQNPSEAASRPADATVDTLCMPDDVFVRTCRAVERLALPLTDPYLLKALSRDTLEFLVRVTARELDEKPFTESGLVEIGAFMHAALEQVGRDRPRPGALAPPLLDLADRLSAGVQASAFKHLQDGKTPQALEALLQAGVVRPWVGAGCPPTGACEARFFEGCEPFSGLDDPGKRGRDALFDALFLTTDAPLARGMNAPCDEAFKAPSQKTLLQQCRQARLAHNLYGNLMRARCAQGKHAVRTAFRELGYVVGEQRVYRDALSGLGQSTAALDAFLDAVQRIDPVDLPREELSAAVRFLGAYAAALEVSPRQTELFLRTLGADLRDAADRPGLASYSALLHGAALRTRSPIDGPGIAALRGATKDLLTLPAFAVIRYQRDVDRLDPRIQALVTAGVSATRSVNRLLETVIDPPPGRAPASVSLGALAAFVTDLADVTASMAQVLRVWGELPPPATGVVPVSVPRSPLADRAQVFEHAAVALKRGGGALQLAADRDWMGLAIQVSDEIGRRGALGNVEEVERSMRFVRVLLAMYQAESVADAKNIFQTALDEEGSRERRFDAWTVDAAALFGVRGGAQYTREGGLGTERVSNATLAGLFVPFGVQVAARNAGALFYPLDLGSYLVATTDPSGSEAPATATQTVRWHDALRFGAALYLRGRTVPIALGFGGDYRPPLETPAQWRVYGTLALELPLFAVH